MDACARPELLDAVALRERFGRLAQAAESPGDERFVSELAAAAPALVGYLLSFELEGSPPELTRTYTGDAFGRFLHTLELTPRPLAGSILEIGAGPYLFHVLLRAVFPKATVVGSNFFDHDIFSTRIGSVLQRLHSPRLGETLEFDYPTFNLETVHPYPYPAGSFDVVYFCETLEHLVVNPLRVFREIRRILRPGGHLVVTLPNALRLTNVAAMLAGRNFYDLYCVGNGVHGRHNREFSLPEVRGLLEGDGFEVVRAETRDRLDYDTVPIEAVDYSGPAAPLPFRKADIDRSIREAGGSLADRGDNIYVVARRPFDVRAPRDGVDRLVSFVDVFDDTGEALHITGWAFFTDDFTGHPAEFDVIVSAGGSSTIHRASTMSRPDVASAHGLEHDVVGYAVAVPFASRPSPPVEVRLRVRSSPGSIGERLLRRW